MKLGFICPHLPGHFNPMSALAHQLQTRNHDVVFLFSPSAGGLPFVPGDEKDHFHEGLPEASKLEGADAVQFSARLLMLQTEAILKSLPKVVEQTGVEALLIDTVQFHAEVGAIQLGIPYIHISNALHFDYSGYTPIAIHGWAHETTPQAQARNREGVQKFVEFLMKGNAGVRAYAQRAGLKIDFEDPASTVSPWASISQTPRSFDFESSHWPAQFHHTGPWHDARFREPVPFPWERLTGEPLVYASMGTILNGRPDVFRTIAAAVAKHRDVQMVLSVGEQVDPKAIGPVPANAIVVRRAPQLELLKLSSACVTHAGLNTVLESLAQGVPQVAIPVAYDQPGVAARIADKQTGLVTSLDKLTADHLSDLLGEVLHNPRYRHNAGKIQKSIEEADGLSWAAGLVEGSLGMAKKV